VADQIDRAEKLIFDISQKNNVRDFVHIERLMPDAIEEIGRLRTHEGTVSGIRTGYGDLDRYLNGFHPKNLMILAARPSIGKTAFALNLMLNIARDGKVPVAIFSLEMGADQLNRRLMCCHAEISGHAVASGRLSEAEFKRLREKSAELAECPIHIDDSPGLSIMQVRARARRLKNRHPDLGLLVVDYLQLMRGSDRGAKDANRQQEVSEISRGLKELANELSLPVLALSQLSRNIEQRSGKDKSARPMLSDLRESGAIEQDADIVMFVHRDRVETQLNEDGKPASHRLAIPTEIIIGKHRNGPIGTAQLMFFADSTRFASTDPSINYG
jgi:replicative DNA helicase